MSDEQNIKRVCSFCVSDLHLVTMLLPYLDKKIKEKVKYCEKVGYCQLL